MLYSHPIFNALAEVGLEPGYFIPENVLTPDFPIVDQDKTKLRDILDSILRKKGGSWSNEYWDHIATFKKAAIKVDSIEDTLFDSYRIHRFKKCHWIKSKGYIRQSFDGKKIYREKKSCGEKTCLLCDTNKRKRLAFDHIKTIKALFKGQPGGPGTLHINFTLPEHLESLPLKNSDLEKNLKNSIQSIVRKLFGVNTRSNIGMRLSIHMVGSRDVFRDRWHCHVDIVPAEIRNKKFRWLEPVKYTDPNAKWKIKLSWANEEWRKALEKEGLEVGEKLAHPEFEFFAYDPDKPDEFFKRLTHRLEYNMRSFARDFEKVMLRSDYQNKRLVLKGSYKGLFYWYEKPASEVVERFLFIRKHTQTRSRGFLQCLEAKYSDIVNLIFEEKEEVNRNEFWLIDAEIITLYEKPRSGENKFTIEKTVFWTWEDPATKEKIIANEEDLKRWPGG